MRPPRPGVGAHHRRRAAGGRASPTCSSTSSGPTAPTACCSSIDEFDAVIGTASEDAVGDGAHRHRPVDPPRHAVAAPAVVQPQPAARWPTRCARSAPTTCASGRGRSTGCSASCTTGRCRPTRSPSWSAAPAAGSPPCTCSTWRPPGWRRASAAPCSPRSAGGPGPDWDFLADNVLAGLPDELQAVPARDGAAAAAHRRAVRRAARRRTTAGSSSASSSGCSSSRRRWSRPAASGRTRCCGRTSTACSSSGRAPTRCASATARRPRRWSARPRHRGAQRVLPRRGLAERRPAARVARRRGRRPARARGSAVCRRRSSTPTRGCSSPSPASSAATGASPTPSPRTSASSGPR